MVNKKGPPMFKTLLISTLTLIASQAFALNITPYSAEAPKAPASQ